MKKQTDIKTVAANIEALGQNLADPTKNHQTTPEDREKYIDAINQIFALFRLNYHNQYYSAYPDAEQIKQIKKLWLESLAKYPVSVLLNAAKAAIEQSEYLPTLSRMHEFCRAGLTEFGLPSERAAYLEACRAGSPKLAHTWSHPAVYLAGRDAGWFTLSSESESVSFPLFQKHYAAYVDKVLAGEPLSVPALPDQREHHEPLPADQQLEQLKRLRESLTL